MQAYDAKTLGERLNELAEVFDKKPVSEKALTVWFGVLREFPTEKVCAVLIGWPKKSTKFPSPSEVWKSVNDMSIGDRDAKAAVERKAEFTPSTPEAKRFIERMRETLKRPALTPVQHWKWNIERFPKGHIGHDFALQALKKKNILVADVREPGQDDEERLVA